MKLKQEYFHNLNLLEKIILWFVPTTKTVYEEEGYEMTYKKWNGKAYIISLSIIK